MGVDIIDDKNKTEYLNFQYRLLSTFFSYDVYCFIHRYFDDISNFMPLLEHGCSFSRSIRCYKELRVYGELLRFLYKSWPVKYNVIDLVEKYRQRHIPVMWFLDDIDEHFYIKEIKSLSTYIKETPIVPPFCQWHPYKESVDRNDEFAIITPLYKDIFGRLHLSPGDASFLHLSENEFKL